MEPYNPDGTISFPIHPYNPLEGVGIPISSSTNSTPIVVTTTGAHGMQTGDTVVIEGHLVNTNANGRWTITVQSSTSFAINGTSGNGVGGSTGYVNDYSIGPIIQIVDDGDPCAASTYNLSFEGLANTNPFFYERVGKYRVYNLLKNGDFAAFPGDYLYTATNFSNLTWVPVTGLTSLLTSPSLAYAGNPPVCSLGDILDVDFECGYQLSGTAPAAFFMALDYSASGVSHGINASSISFLTGDFSTNPLSENGTASLHSRMVITTGAQSGAYNFGVQVYMRSSSPHANDITISTGWSLRVTHYRAN